MVMMRMMRLDVDAAAFAASDDCAVGVMMSDVDEKLRLAGAAAIGLVAAALADGLSGLMRDGARRFRRAVRDNDHVELGHSIGSSAWARHPAASRISASYHRTARARSAAGLGWPEPRPAAASAASASVVEPVLAAATRAIRAGCSESGCRFRVATRAKQRSGAGEPIHSVRNRL
jgi:hypothetical protein